jgi:uncharacterized membrane protein YfcA
MQAMLALSGPAFLGLAAIVLLAGLVRGFSGFALSAIVMALGVMFLPPVELIPMLWIQEMAASLLMVRGGLKEADKMRASLLVVGSWCGWPIGLYFTTSLPVAQSKQIALMIILTLAVMLLARLRIAGLESRLETVMAGLIAGIASGLANVGGMVVALYTLAQDTPARMMRATLIVFLFLSSLGSLLTLLSYGVMDLMALARGLVFAPITLLGVWMGAKMFSPRWEPYYRPFCLGLLIILAMISLIVE